MLKLGDLKKVDLISYWTLLEVGVALVLSIPLAYMLTGSNYFVDEKFTQILLICVWIVFSMAHVLSLKLRKKPALWSFGLSPIVLVYFMFFSLNAYAIWIALAMILLMFSLEIAYLCLRPLRVQNTS
jgi:hypothetical protein